MWCTARVHPTSSTATMLLIPAIDLLGGRVVRLARGAFDAVTEMMVALFRAGAERL